jgi:hypothetical protein
MAVAGSLEIVFCIQALANRPPRSSAGSGSMIVDRIALAHGNREDQPRLGVRGAADDDGGSSEGVGVAVAL